PSLFPYTTLFRSGGCGHVDLTELRGEVEPLEGGVVLLVDARAAVRGPLEELDAIFILRLHVDLHEALGNADLAARAGDRRAARVEFDDPHVRALDGGSARRVSCHFLFSYSVGTPRAMCAASRQHE